MSPPPGRYCELHGLTEVTDLEYGMDFRRPEYRRETFLRFYEFHLRYRAHPGCVYYLLPGLAQRFNWSVEAKLWFAFINGNTQNPVTSWRIFRHCQAVPTTPTAFNDLASWFKVNQHRLFWDTDRRYFRTKFLANVQEYARRTEGAQGQFFDSFLAHCHTPQDNFRALWPVVTKFPTFGRLSAFSYLEYLSLSGIALAPDTLLLDDQNGSKSHRNGLCKVLGRDDLDWHESNPGFNGDYSAVLPWLVEEGATLLWEAQVRADSKQHGYPFVEREHVNYFTLESALCTYKSWHRMNRRYPNVYNDMLELRLLQSETAWGDAVYDLWELRRRALPVGLRREANPADPGLVPMKQNHYLFTGQPVMMDRDWPCFKNDLNDAINTAQTLMQSPDPG